MRRYVLTAIMLLAACLASPNSQSVRIGAVPNRGINPPELRVIGVADSTPGFQASIDALAVKGGGILRIPVGLYEIEDLRLRSKVALVGSGPGTVLRHRAGAVQDMIRLSDPGVHWTKIENLAIDGNKDNIASEVDVIHYVNSGAEFGPYPDPNHVFRDVWIYNAKRDGIYLSQYTKVSFLENVYVISAGRHGFNLECTDSTFIGCVSGLSGSHGFYIPIADNSSFHGCKAYGAGVISGEPADGWHIKGHNLRLCGCEGQENGRHGISFDGGGGHVLSACDTNLNGKSERWNDGSGLDFDNGASYVSAASHKSTGNRTSAVHISGSCFQIRIQLMSDGAIDNRGSKTKIILNADG